jgi:hypothetical protein
MTTLTSSRMAYSQNETNTKYTSFLEQPARPGERLSHAMQRITDKSKESEGLIPVTFHGRPISRPISHEIELFGSLSSKSNHLNKVIPPLDDNHVATFERIAAGKTTSNLRMHEGCGLKPSTAFDVPWGTLLSNPVPSKVVWKRPHLVHSRTGHVFQPMTRSRNAATPAPKSQRQPSHNEKPLIYQRRVPRQCLYTPERTTVSNEQGCDVHFLCRRVRRVMV